MIATFFFQFTVSILTLTEAFLNIKYDFKPRYIGNGSEKKFLIIKQMLKK